MLEKIEQSFTFKNGLIAKNRMTVAALTNTQSNKDGSLGVDEQRWLNQLIDGNFGVIFTCASYISPTAKAWQGQLGIHHDEMLTGLLSLAEQFKKQETLGIMQIFHGGSRCSQHLTGVQPVSASAFSLPLPNFEAPRALTNMEINTIIDDFAQATKRAYHAGFAGVEIHGANGYLITQFISTQTNLRTDEYGGCLKNRAKLAREIMRACRAQVPKNFLVGIRLSPEGDGLDIDENIELAKWLLDDGADFIDLSLRDLMAPSIKYKTSKKPVAAYFREKLNNDAILFAGGSINTAEQVSVALPLNIDFLTVGRIAIGNPNWPMLLKNHPNKITLPPYSLRHLREIGTSEAFINYLTEQLPPAFSQTIVT